MDFRGKSSIPIDHKNEFGAVTHKVVSQVGLSSGEEAVKTVLCKACQV